MPESAPANGNITPWNRPWFQAAYWALMGLLFFAIAIVLFSYSNESFKPTISSQAANVIALGLAALGVLSWAKAVRAWTKHSLAK